MHRFYIFSRWWLTFSGSISPEYWLLCDLACRHTMFFLVVQSGFILFIRLLQNFKHGASLIFIAKDQHQPLFFSGLN